MPTRGMPRSRCRRSLKLWLQPLVNLIMISEVKRTSFRRKRNTKPAQIAFRGALPPQLACFCRSCFVHLYFRLKGGGCPIQLVYDSPPRATEFHSCFHSSSSEVTAAAWQNELWPEDASSDMGICSAKRLVVAECRRDVVATLGAGAEEETADREEQGCEGASLPARLLEDFVCGTSLSATCQFRPSCLHRLPHWKHVIQLAPAARYCFVVHFPSLSWWSQRCLLISRAW